MNPSLMMPEEGMTVDELSNFVAEQLKRLNLVLKSIDGLNIVDIKFELQGGAYIQLNRKGLEFFDGTKKTFTVDVNGIATLTGVKVQSSESYPRVEFSATEKAFKVYKDADTYVLLDTDITGDPGFLFKSPTVEALVTMAADTFLVNAITGNAQLSSNENVNIKAGLGGIGTVNYDSWTKVKNAATSQTLQSALDSAGYELSYTSVTKTLYLLNNSGVPISSVSLA